MINKITQGHIGFLLILIALNLTGCKKDQKTSLRPAREGAYVDMPLGGDYGYGSVSVFDEDVEAFVLEEESLESPFDGSLSNQVSLAYNQPDASVQDFTFEQLDTKDDMQTVYFSYDSKDPDHDQDENLRTLAQRAQAMNAEGRIVCCKGHSCRWHGTRAYNIALSMNRANVIASYLENEAGIPKSNIKIFGVGNEEPVALENTKDGQAPNRRVEVYALAA